MTSNDCAHIEELISVRLDGAATPDELAQIARHLDDCADCQTTVAAFAQVDQRVRTYLHATPVPEIAAARPAARRAGGFARWRPATIALTTILILIAASVLTFRAFNLPTGPAQQVSAPQSAYTTSGGAAAPTAAGAAIGAAVPTAAGASERNAAPAMAPAASSRATARVTSAGSAANADPINPTRLLRLTTATSLTICQPSCDAAAPQGTELLKQVVTALDMPLAMISPLPATATAPIVLLRFTVPEGQPVDLRYYPTLARIGLPSGELVAAPPALIEALAGVVTPP